MFWLCVIKSFLWISTKAEVSTQRSTNRIADCFHLDCVESSHMTACKDMRINARGLVARTQQRCQKCTSNRCKTDTHEENRGGFGLRSGWHGSNCENPKGDSIYEGECSR
jgi:hypothetical protein